MVIKFEAGLRLQSLREHAVHLEGRKKLMLGESSVVRRPARPGSSRSKRETSNLLSFAHLASGLRSHALTFHWSRQPPPLLFAEALGNWLRSHGAVRGAGGRAMKASEPRLNEIVVRGVRKSK